MASSSLLENLTLELLQYIVGLLPDPSSLCSAILASSTMYNAFIQVEVPVTSQVVRNLIDVDVLPEAAAAWKSSHLAGFTRNLLQNFVDDQLRPRQAPPLSWTLSEALSLNDLQRHVEHFSLDFASRVSKKLFESSDSNTMPWNFPTPSEHRRIQRAFYRFEIYCNLFRFRKPPAFDINEQRTVFFSRFSPWVNEQLGCVHDYLFYKLSPGGRSLVYVSILTADCDSFQ